VGSIDESVDATSGSKAKRQRREEGGRRHRPTVKLSDREYAVISARAESLGISVPRLLVESAMAGSVQPVTERHALYSQLIAARRTLAALGNNLNQIARAANSGAAVPPEVAAAAAHVIAAVGRVDLVAGQLFSGRSRT